VSRRGAAAGRKATRLGCLEAHTKRSGWQGGGQGGGWPAAQLSCRPPEGSANVGRGCTPGPIGAPSCLASVDVGVGVGARQAVLISDVRSEAAQADEDQVVGRGSRCDRMGVRSWSWPSVWLPTCPMVGAVLPQHGTVASPPIDDAVGRVSSLDNTWHQEWPGASL